MDMLDNADEEQPARAPAGSCTLDPARMIAGVPRRIAGSEEFPDPAEVRAGVDGAAYKAALARFASGVTITTTRVDGVDHAMTATAFTSVSLRPPLVLVCVERVARFHAAVVASGTWGVSLLAADTEDVATWLATRGRSLDRQLDGIAIQRGRTGVPLLAAATARLECRTWAVHDGGDHSIVVGEVLAAEVGTRDDPLVYYDGEFHTAAPTPAAGARERDS